MNINIVYIINTAKTVAGHVTLKSQTLGCDWLGICARGGGKGGSRIRKGAGNASKTFRAQKYASIQSEIKPGL